MSRALLVFPFLSAVLGAPIPDRNELIAGEALDEALAARGAQSLEIIPEALPLQYAPRLTTTSPPNVISLQSGMHTSPTSALNAISLKAAPYPSPTIDGAEFGGATIGGAEISNSFAQLLSTVMPMSQISQKFDEKAFFGVNDEENLKKDRKVVEVTKSKTMTGKQEQENDEETEEIGEIDTETDFAENDEIATTIGTMRRKTKTKDPITELPAQFVEMGNAVGIRETAEEILQSPTSSMIDELSSLPTNPTVIRSDQMDPLELFMRFLGFFLMSFTESTENEIAEMMEMRTTEVLITIPITVESIHLSLDAPSSTTRPTTPSTLPSLIDRLVSFFRKAQILTNCSISECQQ
ncbi:unnamed protein product, partial [Mesorhabditis belari]|uniref:Uncharacterized protein n=1 Tax=Mesorhabditis belari TaxID=2138241 RepID=A0AAF3F989_9BILA